MPRFPVNQKTREEPGRGAPHISREIVAATKEVLDYTEGGIADIQVAVINASTVLTDAQVRDVVPALQLQVHRDLAPACNIDADLTFVPKGAQPPANTWWLAILDDSTQAGALGFHETTTQGMPLGLAFARTAAEDGVNWTVTASHELLEMLVDPEINLTVFVQHTNTTGTFMLMRRAIPAKLTNSVMISTGSRSLTLFIRLGLKPSALGEARSSILGSM
jgi:hypothetical protein